MSRYYWLLIRPVYLFFVQMSLFWWVDSTRLDRMLVDWVSESDYITHSRLGQFTKSYQIELIPSFGYWNSGYKKWSQTWPMSHIMRPRVCLVTPSWVSYLTLMTLMDLCNGGFYLKNLGLDCLFGPKSNWAWVNKAHSWIFSHANYMLKIQNII